MVRKYLDLSLSHLTVETADRLFASAEAPVPVWPDPHPHDGASCFVYVPDGGAAAVDDCPEDLARCIDLARSLGCDRICFDRDGEVHEALPVLPDAETE